MTKKLLSYVELMTRDHHIDLDGKSYEYFANSSRFTGFKYDELPLFDFIYEELKGAFIMANG